MDSIQATQDKGEFPSEVAGYSVADNQALREVSPLKKKTTNITLFLT